MTTSEILSLGALAALMVLLFWPARVVKLKPQQRGRLSPDFHYGPFCDAAFRLVVEEEWDKLIDAGEVPIYDLIQKWGWVSVVPLDDPPPGIHPDGRDVFGDFRGIHGQLAVIGVYRHPVERYHAACVSGVKNEPVISVREHINRILRHELAHASMATRDGPMGFNPSRTSSPSPESISLRRDLDVLNLLNQAASHTLGAQAAVAAGLPTPKFESLPITEELLAKIPPSDMKAIDTWVTKTVELIRYLRGGMGY